VGDEDSSSEVETITSGSSIGARGIYAGREDKDGSNTLDWNSSAIRKPEVEVGAFVRPLWLCAVVRGSISLSIVREKSHKKSFRGDEEAF
jgi:hypothetical protein